MTQTLTSEQAYRAMLLFLEGYLERTDSDDLAGLLGGFAINDSDSRPMDPAAESDWDDAVQAARRST